MKGTRRRRVKGWFVGGTGTERGKEDFCWVVPRVRRICWEGQREVEGVRAGRFRLCCDFGSMVSLVGHYVGIGAELSRAAGCLGLNRLLWVRFSSQVLKADSGEDGVGIS